MHKKNKKYLFMAPLVFLSITPVFFVTSCNIHDNNRPQWNNQSENSNLYALDFTNTENIKPEPSNPNVKPNPSNPNVKPNPSNPTVKPEPPKPHTSSLVNLFGYKIIKAEGSWENNFNILREETQPILEKMNFKKNIEKADISTQEFIDLFFSVKKELIKRNDWLNYQIDYFEIFEDSRIKKYFSVDRPKLKTISNKSYRKDIDIRFFFTTSEDPNKIQLSVQIYHDKKDHLDRRRRSVRVKRHDPTVSLTPLFTIEIPWI